MFNKIDTVVFDMDGVIFDTERVYLEIWKYVFEKYGYEIEDETYISVMGTGRENVVKKFVEMYGNALPISDMYKEKDRILFDKIAEGIPIKRGVISLLSFLKTNGYKLALATSAKCDRVKRQFKNSKVEKYFDVVVCGDDIKKGKPDPEIFLKAIDLLNSKEENSIIIEDSLAGIKAAYYSNALPIHVEDLKRADENVKCYCYRSFEDCMKIKEFLEENKIT